MELREGKIDYNKRCAICTMICHEQKAPDISNIGRTCKNSNFCEEKLLENGKIDRN